VVAGVNAWASERFVRYAGVGYYSNAGLEHFPMARTREIY
jgi:hypothetical protein